MKITGPNSFTKPVRKSAQEGFDALVQGTFVATVSVQISKTADENTWITIASIREASIQVGAFGTPWWIRAGVKAGDFTSGEIEVELY